MKNGILVKEKSRKAERNATFASCCGFLGEVTLTDSAVIILFAGLLGASDMFSMITTSFLPLFNGLLIIPMAWVATKVGCKKLIMISCVLASIAYFAAVSAPFWGVYSVSILISMILLFALCLSGFIAGWFPLLDTFLVSDRRTVFFSKMRFSHQLTAVTFLFLVGMVIGEKPETWMLQVVLLLGAIIFTGRAYFVTRVPHFDTTKKRTFGFKLGLLKALENKPLTGFSLYLFILNLTAFGTIPMMTIYLKKHLNAPDNVIIMISAMTLLGMLTGYLAARKMIKFWTVKGTLLWIHVSYVFVNFALFFIFNAGLATYIITAVLLFIYSFMMAVASIVTSAEMMALASPGNKTMALAFCGAFSFGGSGVSRLISSLILGTGILAPSWSLGPLTICHYQTMFLIYAISISVAAAFLLLVPAIFPRGEFVYNVQ